MEMTLNLTFEDGMKVVEAMRNVAIENGWNPEELNECGVIEEYSGVLDAALAAMGIKVNIDYTPSDDDSFIDEDDFDEEDFDEEDFEDEEDLDDEEEVNPSTVKEDFILQCLKAGYSLREACDIANILFGEDE